ncbi:hypothetical protein FCL40_05710 [Ferrimonas sediminicola]|uniref:Lecithin retinol acyltransferase n=1 Tax=Ferrimonas sediminicola TaxID=2569538 RepID=A0A4U1BHU0_9GAMM|nr:hypothetical protein [Ferrimonas sediminicola]TKB50644.1 hypothetical protein FCL40_05710 [Ferrimonas sediminicola]
MAIPWILAALAGGLAAADYKRGRDRARRRRYHELSPDPRLKLRPSEWDEGKARVDPRPGSLVACHVYGAVEHVGLWVAPDQIIELHGSGLVRLVSPRRFVQGRTGRKLFVCVDRHHRPLTVVASVERAARCLYQHRNYDLFRDNCYRFVWYCLTGEQRRFDSFGGLNRALAGLHGCDLYWDAAKVDLK